MFLIGTSARLFSCVAIVITLLAGKGHSPWASGVGFSESVAVSPKVVAEAINADASTTPSIVTPRVAGVRHEYIPALSSRAPQPSLERRESSGDSTAVDTTYRICRVTAYCDRGTTASGVRSGVGQCAAPADIPFGALVYIPALDRSFVVTDRTHKRFRKNTVDLFMPSKYQCKQFGCNYLECVITVDEDRSVRQRRLAAFRR